MKKSVNHERNIVKLNKKLKSADVTVWRYYE